MNDLKLWWLGVALIIAYILIGEFAIVFREYVFSRLGLNRDFLLTFLLLLPVIASFLVVYLSKERSLLKGLSLIPVLTVLWPIVHFLFGYFGATIDFGGLAAIRVNFPIALVLSSLTIGFGSIVGILLKKNSH